MQIQNIGSDITYIDEPVKVPTIFRVGHVDAAARPRGQRLVVRRGVLPPSRQHRAGERRGWSTRSATSSSCAPGGTTGSTRERFSLGGGVRAADCSDGREAASTTLTPRWRSSRDPPDQHRVSFLAAAEFSIHRQRLPARGSASRLATSAFSSERRASQAGAVRRRRRTVDKPAGRRPGPGSSRPARTRKSRIRCRVMVCRTSQPRAASRPRRKARPAASGRPRRLADHRQPEVRQQRPASALEEEPVPRSSRRRKRPGAGSPGSGRGARGRDRR